MTTQRPATARETYAEYLDGKITIEEVERRIRAWETSTATPPKPSDK